MAGPRRGEDVAVTQDMCLGVEEGRGCSDGKDARGNQTAEGSECPVKGFYILCLNHILLN